MTKDLEMEKFKADLLASARELKSGKSAHKRLILSHHKNLNHGDFLVDDRTKNGVDKFQGMHIHFGTPLFPDWITVTRFLKTKV